MIKRFLVFAASLFAVHGALAANPVVEIRTSAGLIVVELYPEKAPKTVENFLRYVKDDFYRGTVFHRIIDGYIVQGGGRLTNYAPKPRRAPIEPESDNGLKNTRGTVAAARFPSDPQSATSEFFINLADNARLDKGVDDDVGYTVFGSVRVGMGVVENMGKMKTSVRDNLDFAPEKPIVINSIKVVEEK